MKRVLAVILMLLILAIAFPLEAAAKLFPSFNRWFSAIIAPTYVHVLLHLFLFTTLAFFGSWALQWRWGSVNITQTLTVVLAVAFFQEALQMLGGRHGLRGDELFDFFVDLCGGCFGYAVYRLYRRLSRTFRS